jgi:hypothetical protein
VLFRLVCFGSVVIAVLVITRWRIRPRVGTRALVSAGCVAALMFGAQVVQDERKTYPLLSWRMYADRMPPAGFSRWVDLASGERLYPFALIAPLEPRALAYRVDQLIARCQCGSGDPVVDEFIARLLALYEDAGGSPVEQVGVEVVAVRPIVPSERSVRRYTWHRRQVR